eukprot:TRINITY_DN112614_c0_g1_i1.p1 TRINITY_DN112614_c0_g1~~TRINITY_DN112614_c0_g1_i1.p1  ORF type:complete len:513 (-),score=95.61 TRINITY_DN112614_c0_g1_i1:37-1407(-)
MDFDDDFGPEEGEASAPSSKKGKRFPKLLHSRTPKALPEDTAQQNIIIEANLLEVDSKVISPPMRQLTVRLASVGFCMAELGGVYQKLFKAINHGDDSDCPTRRHNDARRLICEELPDLQWLLQDHGHRLVRYLAARLVFWELKSELFERLYFQPQQVVTPGNAGGGNSLNQTAGSSALGTSFGGGDGGGTAPLTLESVLACREDSFLGLLENSPAPLLMMFVVELGKRITDAWTYVILDYLRRQKVDTVMEFLDDDLAALKHLMAVMMKAARRRVASNAREGSGQQNLSGLSMEDCDRAEQQLEQVQHVAQTLLLRVNAGTADSLARYAGKVRGDLPAIGENTSTSETLFFDRPKSPAITETRSMTPRGGSTGINRGRSASPAVAGRFGGAGMASASAAGADRQPSPSPEGSRSPRMVSAEATSKSSKPMWQRAWKATKRAASRHSHRKADGSEN